MEEPGSRPTAFPPRGLSQGAIPSHPSSPTQAQPHLQFQPPSPPTFLLVTPASCWLHHQSPNSSSAHLGPTWDPPWPAHTRWQPCLPITLPPAQASPVLSCSKPRLQCSPYTPCPDSWANGSELSARLCFPCFPLQSEHLFDPSNKFLTFLKAR